MQQAEIFILPKQIKVKAKPMIEGKNKKITQFNQKRYIIKRREGLARKISDPGAAKTSAPDNWPARKRKESVEISLFSGRGGNNNSSSSLRHPCKPFAFNDGKYSD
jgi:hypothetical protein